MWSLPFFFTKSVAMATALEISIKRGPDPSSASKTLSFSEKIAKIGPADPQIICLREIIKEEEEEERNKLRKGDKCRWGGLKLATFDEKRATT